MPLTERELQSLEGSIGDILDEVYGNGQRSAMTRIRQVLHTHREGVPPFTDPRAADPWALVLAEAMVEAGTDLQTYIFGPLDRDRLRVALMNRGMGVDVETRLDAIAANFQAARERLLVRGLPPGSQTLGYDVTVRDGVVVDYTYQAEQPLEYISMTMEVDTMTVHMKAKEAPSRFDREEVL